MTPGDWLDVLRTEYLETFIRDGGAAVKFAVALDPEGKQGLDSGLRSTAEDLGFMLIKVDAAETRIHMVDQILYRMAAQLDWNSLCARVLAPLAEECGFRLPGDGNGPFGDRLAEANETNAKEILIGMRPILTKKIFRNRDLAKDFRTAMLPLCMSQLSPGDEASLTAQVLTDWLSGRNKSVGAVRPYSIFNRITRANARHLLESMLAWIKLAGYPGTILHLDIDRLSIPRNPRDERPFYTAAALLDAYEVLRQFIDGSDRLTACLLLVTADTAFLDQDPQGRGLRRYEALNFRVFDEIHDRDRANPMASLIRLAGRVTEGELS